MPDDDDEISVRVRSSERRECALCRQETTWNYYEYRRWFGLLKTQYWACGRCGKSESLAAPASED